jgi:carbohydrate-binding DOMON domain-containing protein
MAAILDRMPSRRIALTVLAIFALAGGLTAGPALAGGGPSAGNSQYTDPLAGLTNTSTSSSHPTQTATAPATTPTQVTSAPSTGVSSAAADPSTTATAATDPRTLPFTGYDAWLVALVGLALAGLGFAVRRRAA